MGYIITVPVENPHRALSLPAFEDALAADWRPGRIGVSPASGYLQFDIELEGAMLSGAFAADGVSVILDGTIEASARFAVWYRKLISRTVPLVIVHDDSGKMTKVDYSSTTASLVSAFDALR
jgi:hypothetical protein